MSRDSVSYITNMALKNERGRISRPSLIFHFVCFAIGLRVISHKHIQVLVKSAALRYRKIDFYIPFLFIDHRPVRYIKLIPMLI